jgi:hypothetical protein
MKNIVMVGGVILLFIFGTAVFNSQKQKKQNNQETESQNIAMSVPLPTERDIIQSFFQRIDIGRHSDAVRMMTSSINNNDATKQAYGVQFNAIDSVTITNIDDSMKEEWTPTKHQFKVTLEMAMNPTSANEPIPYFGYTNGENMRFITLIKESKMWRVAEIATGP